MDKIAIIGGGFSSYLAYKKLEKYNPIIITPVNFFLKNDFEKDFSLIRRKNIEINKIFKDQAKSYGSIKFDNKKIILHDRLAISGNSKIWGGFCNFDLIKNKYEESLKKFGVYSRILDLKTTKCCSNNKNIRQLINKKGEIFNIKSNMFVKIIDGYVISFENINKKMKISYLIKKQKKIMTENIFVDKIILSLNLPQYLDLFYRCKLIKNSDLFRIDEFDYSLNFFTNTTRSDNSLFIKYSFDGLLQHFFGKNIKYVPNIFFTYQIFSNKKNTLNFNILNNKIILENKVSKIFGKSIHYNNLTVNHISMNKFLSNYSKNVLPLGMTAVKQNVPGPISNDIINDSFQKLE